MLFQQIHAYLGVFRVFVRSVSALLLTKISPPFPIPGSRFDTLNFVKFMQSYGTKLSYGGSLNKLTIRDLGFTFDVNTGKLKAYQTYFETKDCMHIYRVGNRIFSEVDGLKFVVPFPIGLLELKETYIDEFYKINSIKGKTVLDIGAFIGDTPIYFARQGASHVFAFEPAPPLFRIAFENIQLNNLSDRITLRNEALADACKLMSFQYDENWPGGSKIATVQSANTGAKTCQVQGVTLKQIIKETGNVGLLKMDIEGAEHQLISKAIRDKVFDQIESVIMEVHGSNLNLIRLLETDGFAVVVLRTFSTSLSLISAIRKNSPEFP